MIDTTDTEWSWLATGARNRTHEGGLARGLPRRAFLDKNVPAREYQNWLAGTWMLAGTANEIPKAGDLLPVPYLRLFLARGRDGTIRAFHNICRHRGHELVKECKNAPAVVCPYHGWSYDLTGKLRATSEFSGKQGTFADGFDPTAFSLRQVRCEHWHDLVFINLDGEAPPLEEHLSALIKRVGSYPLSTARPFHTFEHGEVKANWKLIMENSLEPYHTPYVHKQTGAGIPLDEHYTIIEKGLIGCGVDRPDPDGMAVANGSIVGESHFLSVPPLLIFVVYADSVVIVHRNLPSMERPDRTWRTVYLYDIGETPLSKREMQEWRDLTRIIHLEEDGPVYENIQRGKQSPVTDDGGVLSPAWEAPVRAFYDLWFEKMMKTGKLS